MFRKVGPARTGSDDRKLAAYLALIAGIVNSAGFVLIGAFTSHVTGNVGRVAEHVAARDGAVAMIAAASVGTFFLGSVVCSMAAESNVFGDMSRTSAALLVIEAALVTAFVGTSASDRGSVLAVHEAPAMLLSAAMGLQNALVTRLSGAVVRTTHLTGVVTDLGIEVARWFRFWRVRTAAARGIRLTVTSTPAELPQPPKIALLATIFVFFVVGSAVGAVTAVRFSHLSLAPVIVLLVGGAIHALRSGATVVVRGKSDSKTD